MSKTLAIFGATGTQGSSLLNYVIADPQLSKEFNIRAITRDVLSEKAVKLASQSVEVTQADIFDPTSLSVALTGVHTLFLVTTPSFGPTALEVELNNIKSVTDIAISSGVSYIIFSTLPAVAKISGGKWNAVTPFDAKAQGEAYIRTLPIKSAFVSLGSFMQNFQSQPYLAPREQPDGTWVMARNTSGKAQYPLIDAVDDVGKFVGAILAEPDKYAGKTLCCATALYTLDEICAALSKNTNKKIVYKQIPTADFRAGLAAMFPPQLADLADIFAEAFEYGEEIGYFGYGMEGLVAEGAKAARGKLTAFDEFLEKNPLVLG